MAMDSMLLLLVVLTLFAERSAAFLSLSSRPNHRSTRAPHSGLWWKKQRDNIHLFGIKEWRDSIEKGENGTPILLLPFAASEALLPGQSTSVILKEGRFYDLFQDCMDDYESMIGMVLMGEDGLLREMPLCEIDDFDVEAGFRGKVTVSVTLRAIARAKILEFTAMKPIMMGMCAELKDDTVPDEDLANELVNDIEATIQDMNLLGGYEKALRLALESTNETRNKAGKRSTSDLAAASWAALSCISDRSCRYKAIASTCVTERLELGLKALLDAKYQTSSIPNESEGESGFE